MCPPTRTAGCSGGLTQVDQRPAARVEVIGKTVRGRDLHLVTVTNFERPDQGKRTVWLQARQHAWEAGTSYVMEGALEFITSEDPIARELRDKVVFMFTPMLDPDGCAGGQVRFNANGYDVNRHWDEVDLRSKSHLERMPEIWYVKKAILGVVDSGRTIDLMLNLHNTETAEYLETQASDAASRSRITGLFEQLVANTSFDPGENAKPRFSDRPGPQCELSLPPAGYSGRADGAAYRYEQEAAPAAHGRGPSRIRQEADCSPGPVSLATGPMTGRNNSLLFLRRFVPYSLRGGSHQTIRV